MKRMQTTTEKSPAETRRSHDYWFGLAVVILSGVMLAVTYAPLLFWLGRMSLEISQLTTGAALVLFALIVCLRGTLETRRFEPGISLHGLGLITVGMFCLWVAKLAPSWALPLAMLSFCLSLAGLISFLFGRLGVRQFLPALGAFLVFGILIGLFPTLDWPMRAVAGKYAGSVLASLGVPVRLALVAERVPELVLQTNRGNFIVATECNGFGLLTSSLLLATILAFHFHLPWLRKLGLLALAIPIAIVANFLRIVSICLIAPRVALPYGFVHEAIGLVWYLAGLVVLWWVARDAMDRPAKPAVAPA